MERLETPEGSDGVQRDVIAWIFLSCFSPKKVKALRVQGAAEGTADVQGALNIKGAPNIKGADSVEFELFSY